MLQADEATLATIITTIDETIKTINEKRDIRLISSMLTKFGNKIRAMAEIKETPNNRFVAYLVQDMFNDIRTRFQGREEEWYELNKETTAECVTHLKNLLTSLKSSIQAKSFEKTVDAMKMFFFAYWQIILRTS